MVNISFSAASIDGNLTYYSDHLSDTQAELVADSFQSIVMQLIDPDRTHIRDLDLLGLKNRDRILGWNRVIPGPVGYCIHKVIHEYSQAHRHAPAVNRSLDRRDSEDRGQNALEYSSALSSKVKLRC